MKPSFTALIAVLMPEAVQDKMIHRERERERESESEWFIEKGRGPMSKRERERELCAVQCSAVEPSHETLSLFLRPIFCNNSLSKSARQQGDLSSTSFGATFCLLFSAGEGGRWGSSTAHVLTAASVEVVPGCGG